MYLTQAIHRAVQINKGGLATICGDRTQTWAVFADRVSRLAGALRSLGVGRGDRVAMLALNSDRYAEYYYATLWLGAVVVPVNTRWSLAEILLSLNDAEPTILFFDDAFSKQAAELKESVRALRHWIHTGEADVPAWASGHDELVAKADSVEDVRAGGDVLAALMYTGGTTGTPKGVMLSHSNIACNCLATSTAFQVNERSVYLHSAPMFHLADAMMLFSITSAAGAHVFLPAFTPEAVCSTVAVRQVSHALLVPTMIRLLLDHLDSHGGDLSSLRSLIYGASPMPETTLRRAITALPKTGFVQAFGQTELSPVATLLGREDHRIDGGHRERLRSAGRAIPGVDVIVTDESGRERPRGTVGEVRVRGPNTMLGYWRRPEATRETLIDGWVRMGDAAYMDEDGFVYVVDRVKDMIISGGENVYCGEVENALMRLDGVSECAVIGVPDDAWGERVHAVIVLKEGMHISEEEVTAHCRDLIASYKCPRSVEFRATPLPLSGAGKVLKTELRQRFWSEEGRGVN
jgi:acyl-CoA synthetase (AMP-forming)/AMP-acid ligase II